MDGGGGNPKDSEVLNFPLQDFTSEHTPGFIWRNWVGGKHDVHAHIFRTCPRLLSLCLAELNKLLSSPWAIGVSL